MYNQTRDEEIILFFGGRIPILICGFDPVFLPADPLQWL